MDYAKAISLNQKALRQVVEEIYVWLELVLDGSVKHLPIALQQAAYRLLIPAESALRRLIVIAARGLKVTLRQHKAAPPVLCITPTATRSPCFQLYDTRKRFGRPPPKPKKTIPRIHFFGPNVVHVAAVPETKKQPTSIRLCRRFAAFKHALENIPQQAKRMALWQAKRARLKQAKFRFPLRPGAPPGFRKNLLFKIDVVLEECHFLACDAQREAPS